MPFILGANSLTGGYTVDNSLRFDDGSSDYLDKTYGSAGNRQIWTYSFWVKKTTNASTLTPLDASSDGNNRSLILFDSDNIRMVSLVSGSVTTNLITSAVYRDVSAWYHIIVAFDSTQATASNRVKFYVNGTQVTSFGTATYPSLNQNEIINNNVKHSIGRDGFYTNQYLDGYMSEINFIDGQALTPTDFGEFDEDSGIWKPIAYAGTYGTNGFYLETKDSGALGADTSGNGNNFTVNNLTAVDQSTDTPTNNFATFNPLFTPNPSNVSTFSEGNLKVVTNSTSQNSDGLSTLGVSSGKYYGEFKLIAQATGESVCGVLNNIENVTTEGLNGTGGFSVASNGDSFNNGSSQGANNFSASYTNNDIIGIALDLDNNRVYFSKNGSYTDGSGNFDESSPTGYFSLTSGQTYFMGVGDKSTSQSSTWEANFGSPSFAISSGNTDPNGYGNFEYAVPSGYYALNTKNLAEYG